MGKSLSGDFGRLTFFCGHPAAAPFDFIIGRPVIIGITSPQRAMPFMHFLISGEVRHAR